MNPLAPPKLEVHQRLRIGRRTWNVCLLTDPHAPRRQFISPVCSLHLPHMHIQISLDGLVETAWSPKLASPFIGKGIKQKVSILPLPDLPNRLTHAWPHRRLQTAQASARNQGLQLGKKGFIAPGVIGLRPPEASGLGQPSPSSALSPAATCCCFGPRETGPFSSRKLLRVAGVSCLVLAPPAC